MLAPAAHAMQDPAAQLTVDQAAPLMQGLEVLVMRDRVVNSMTALEAPNIQAPEAQCILDLEVKPTMAPVDPHILDQAVVAMQVLGVRAIQVLAEGKTALRSANNLAQRSHDKQTKTTSNQNNESSLNSSGVVRVGIHRWQH